MALTASPLEHMEPASSILKLMEFHERRIKVSVVIPTFKRPELLERCLRALFCQTLKRDEFEIIIVDDGQDNVTHELVNNMAQISSAPAVRYLRPLMGYGPAVARNCGWRIASSDLIAFTDDDTIPEKNWLECGLRAIGDNVAVAGQVRVPRPNAEHLRPTDHELMTRGLESSDFVTANAFVKREALLQVGGFDEAFKRAWREDSDLHFRLEDIGSVARCSAAVVSHPVRTERWGISLRQQRNVFFDALLYSKNPSRFRRRVRAHSPWLYYSIVGATLAGAYFGLIGKLYWTWWSLGIAAILILFFAYQRLHHTSHAPKHVIEMCVTSIAIPFLSVYWRLRGAWHFRTFFI